MEEALTGVLMTGALFDPKRSSPETPWSFLILPYLDQTALARRFDFNQGIFGYVDLQPPFLMSGLNANAGVLQETVPAFQCPSDIDDKFQYDVSIILSVSLPIPAVLCGRGNYAANWGNTNWSQSTDLDGDGLPDPGIQFHAGAFSRASLSPTAVRDGLSQTVFVAEIRKGVGLDVRGAYVVPIPGGSHYMSRFRPNGVQDIYGFVPSPSGAVGDHVPFPALCNPSSDIPCSFDFNRLTAFAGSRSQHMGGVYILCGDGASKFVSNNIDHGLWMALHSIAGKDTASGAW